jgi:hypothetical protein
MVSLDGKQFRSTAGQAIRLANGQHISGPQEAQTGRQGCPLAVRASLLGKDALGSSGLQVAFLSGKPGRLVRGAGAAVSDDHGGPHISLAL